ncbi:sugar phosphate isomerase/epimerase family protein [Cohnella candidum]|uniref:Sugar phosphate isomerase/epimerase n=1 Tax=Cohnella candidum TaxID=2674991 RepID=A0A3G3K407_9BACL|nr:sugar phosphate isomerase/epimerase family protein [Cohnella candidum]AYQ75254.1 sugar phosphate isomerase/epimerase [Cohnella candidum]
MRLGGQVYPERQDPESWVDAVRKAGFRAAVCPVNHEADGALIRAYRDAAAANDIFIAEVGAWSNPISADPEVRRQAMEYCAKQLALAEEIGAGCCVNIAGSRGEQWDGPHPDNFSDETFDLIVETVRGIIDQVNPSRTFFTLETMPWTYPDSADTYLALLRAIDRPAFAVHLDPVNMISSPRTYYRNGEMIRDFIAKLGPYIKNCHAKDIKLAGKLTVHLDEVLPGTGALDYRTFLTELGKLGPDTPLIIEHLATEQDYAAAAAFIRGTASELGISL